MKTVIFILTLVVDELVNFYKTSVGKKMDQEYLLPLVESVKDFGKSLKLAVKNIELTTEK